MREPANDSLSQGEKGLRWEISLIGSSTAMFACGSRSNAAYMFHSVSGSCSTMSPSISNSTRAGLADKLLTNIFQALIFPRSGSSTVQQENAFLKACVCDCSRKMFVAMAAVRSVQPLATHMISQPRRRKRSSEKSDCRKTDCNAGPIASSSFQTRIPKEMQMGGSPDPLKIVFSIFAL